MKLLFLGLFALASLVCSVAAAPSSITVSKVCPELSRYFEESSDWDDFDFEEAWNAGQCFGYINAVIELIYLQNPNQLCTSYRKLGDGTAQRVLTPEIVTAVLRYLEGLGEAGNQQPQVAKVLQALEANFGCDE